MDILEIMERASVIPVLEVANLEDAVPLAKALAAGGLSVIELTLRTDCALDALKAMKETDSSLIVGMGTVRTEADVDNSIAAGADFLVSPGAGPKLLAKLAGCGVGALPGVVTASEAMTVQEAGLNAMKFFPAETSGGIPAIKALNGPLPGITFCPTGGISKDLAPEYLALPNVACCGGSWVASKKDIAAGEWAKIEENARFAASLG